MSARMKPPVVTVVAIAALCMTSLVAAGCRGRTAAAAPRTAWGEPDFMGVWKGPRLGANPNQDSFNLTQLERLYTPEARARLQQISAKDDPALRCEPAAFPTAIMLGWPIQIAQKPGMMIVLTEAFTAFRNVPIGKGHLSPDYLIPFFGGDSAGQWEGDTLVVDVISFRNPWLATSQDKPTATSTGVWPASEELHVVERWRRVDADTLEYRARVEDPQMLSAAWETPTVTLTRQPELRIEEVKCRTDDPRYPAASYLTQLARQ